MLAIKLLPCASVVGVKKSSGVGWGGDSDVSEKCRRAAHWCSAERKPDSRTASLLSSLPIITAHLNPYTTRITPQLGS